MSQHDMVLADAVGAAFRADANLALLALISNSSGATEPATMYAYQFWADTTTGLLKQRNSTNTAWITKGSIADTWAAITGLDTQVFSVGVANAAAHAVRADQPKSNIINVTGTVAANALTLGLKAGAVLDFRSTTMTTGVPNTRFVPADISLVISSGSSLGTVNSVQSRIVILAIDNAGTVELAAVNLAGGNNLDETTLISTTAEGGAGAADSASTIYSTTARTNVPFRVVGYVESTQATAGTWATTPSTVQGAGGNALTAMSSFGYSQKVSSYTSGNRAVGTTYYNTTSKPIIVIANYNGTLGTILQLSCTNGIDPSMLSFGQSAVASQVFSLITVVPPGSSYTVNTIAGTPTFNSWYELR